jgi:hypothetical protein
MKQIILSIFLLFFIFNEANAQCFGSPGNPAAGTSNLGTLQKKVIRISFFHRYSFSDQYFQGHKKLETPGIYKDANFNFLGNIVAYGLTSKLTLEAETGYFINKTLNFNTGGSKKGFGLNQTIVSFKFLVADDERYPLKWSASAGAKIPLRFDPQFVDHVKLPVDAQPSQMSAGLVLQSFLLKENSFKGLRYFMINRYEYNLRNKHDFQWGQSLFNSFFVSKRLHFRQQWLTENWTAILQLRHEMKTHNNDYLKNPAQVDASGSQLVFLTPQINYTANKVWNISLMFDIPVYQYYNETQIGTRYAAGLTLTRDFPPKDFIY